MAMSGVALNPEVVEVYNTKLRMGEQKLNAMMLMIDEKGSKEIVLEKKFEHDTLPLEELGSKLPPSEPRYVLYDCKYEKKLEPGQTQPVVNNKIVLICWSPDAASVKKKMLYASSKDAVKKALQAIAVEIQASDLGDLDVNEVTSKLIR